MTIYRDPLGHFLFDDIVATLDEYRCTASGIDTTHLLGVVLLDAEAPVGLRGEAHDALSGQGSSITETYVRGHIPICRDCAESYHNIRYTIEVLDSAPTEDRVEGEKAAARVILDMKREIRDAIEKASADKNGHRGKA